VEQIEVSTVTKQFKRTFDEASLNELGKATRLCRREREATPYRLMLTLIESFATGTLDSIADIHRAFNALCERQVQYKPFHNQLSKAGFPTFVRVMLSRLLNELACDVLRFSPASPFARFEHIRIQDGTSFALKSALADTFPGRFTTISPAAVELHVDLDLMSEMVNQVVLSADSAAERQFLPAVEEVRGGLLLGDRGYFGKDYLHALDRAGGFFILRGKTDMNPLIRKAIGPDGREVKRFRNQRLKAVKSRLSKYDCLDMTVCFDTRGEPFECRLVVHPNLRQDDTPPIPGHQPRPRDLQPRAGQRRLPAALADRAAVQGMEVARKPSRLRHRQPQHRRGPHLGLAMRRYRQALLRSHDATNCQSRDVHAHRRQMHPSRSARRPLRPHAPTATAPNQRRASHRILIEKCPQGTPETRSEIRSAQTWTRPCLCRRLRTNL